VSSSFASLVARDITKSFGPRVVLDGVSCTIGPLHRVGVLAPNGTGKSTLLKILAGPSTRPTPALVTMTPPTATVGYLPQEPSGARARPCVRISPAGPESPPRSRRSMPHRARSPSSYPTPTNVYADALERFLSLGAADFDARLGAVCADLGLATGLLDLEMPALSGARLRARASPRSSSPVSTCSSSTSPRTTSTSPVSNGSNAFCTTS